MQRIVSEKSEKVKSSVSVMWSSKKLGSIWQTVWAIKKAEIDPNKMYTIIILRNKMYRDTIRKPTMKKMFR